MTESSYISEGIFENIQNEDFGFELFEKGQILMPFPGLAPSNFKICVKKITHAFES